MSASGARYGEERRASDLGTSAGVPVGVWLRVLALGGVALTALVVLSGVLSLGLAHRALTLMALAPLVALALACRLHHPRLWPWARAALALLIVDAVIGELVAALNAPLAAGVHLALAALALAATVLLAGLALKARGEPAGHAADYAALTKPRVMSLLLVTAAAAAFVADRGVPPARVLLALIVGGALASGGASAINHVLDSDIDKRMVRTRDRPVAAARVSRVGALEFGLALSAFSFVLLAGALNLLTAALALAGNLFYVFVYTGWLKRSTPQNIVIGGAAGAVPPLVGWAAASGTIDLAAILLFLIVFLWTPPHFWALAILLERDYARAQIPMLPVVKGRAHTARRILAYTVILMGVSLLPYVVGAASAGYLAVALLLGVGFVALAWRLRRTTSARNARWVFHYSLGYLALLFCAMAVLPAAS